MLNIIPFGNVIRYELGRKAPGLGLYWTAAYYVDGILIDAGSAHTSKELADALADKPLSHIINTHSHEDHIGANHLLQSRHDHLMIKAHPEALPIMADPRSTRSLQPYRHILFGQPDGCTGASATDREIIATNHHEFQILYTPGHSPDHLCVWEPKQRWLFSGDLYVGGKDRALRKTNDIRQIIASLKMVAALPVKIMFPGCARIKMSPREELLSKIEYLETIGQRIFELHRQGLKDKAIARRLFGRPKFSEWMTLGNYSRLNLVRSYLNR